jgi:hypothetical protein
MPRGRRCARSIARRNAIVLQIQNNQFDEKTDPISRTARVHRKHSAAIDCFGIASARAAQNPSDHRTNSIEDRKKLIESFCASRTPKTLGHEVRKKDGKKRSKKEKKSKKRFLACMLFIRHTHHCFTNFLWIFRLK